ncbi:MAG: hypothetical protein IPM24_12795 [Bryobacterales bacterium]|nr:hypothetical protein [Bryobacterales bacterium]
MLWLLPAVLAAQPVVAPTPERPGETAPLGAYTFRNSFETGYRFRQVDGNLGKYRSDVNFGNGIRLLSGELSLNSRDGRGRYFDEFVLRTLGLGNDPYQFALVRLQKNGLYRYETVWRRNEYYNPALPVAAGNHFADTARRLQDHDIVLLPQAPVRLFAGYTRNVQDGPALTTVQLFDTRGDEFPLFTRVNRLYNDYRLGAEIRRRGFQLNVLRSWHYFREDAPAGRETPHPGASPENLTALDRFARAEPYRGATPVWRALVRAESDWVAASGRVTYAGGRRDFVLDESAFGTDRFGAAANRQIVVGGNARRPVTSADASVTVFPSRRLNFTQSASYHNTRIDGDSAFREILNGTAGGDLLFFRFLGIRTFTGASDLNWQPTRQTGFFAGYRYAARRIRSVESLTPVPFDPFRQQHEQDNHLHAGAAGIRLRPVRGLTVTADGEIARADRPFTPVSGRRVHAAGGRAAYQAGALRLGAAYRQNYNFNSAAISRHSARGRNYAADASWAPNAWFALDASYAKIHLDTVTGLAFFGLGELQDRVSSVYVSNVHAGNLGVRLGLRRADFFAGYSIVEDTGDGRRSNTFGPETPPLQALLLPVQTFPLRYQSPLARISVPLRPDFRFNFGWQMYHYRENFPITAPAQNYRAHTGFASASWSF